MLFRKACRLTLVALFVVTAGSFSSIAIAKDGLASSHTHKQIRTIKPTHDGKPIALNTFCLDKDGNILACVGGDTTEFVPGEDGEITSKTVVAPKLLQTYSPEGKLLREVSLDFKPTAVNQSPTGTIFVAGVGRVAQISPEGKVLVVADSPHIGDLDEMKKKAEAEAKVQMKQMTGMLTDQIERLDQRLAAIKEKPEADLTDRDKKRIETLEQQKKMYCDQEKEMEEMYSSFFSADAMLERALEITSLAVTSKDVFLCTGAVEGHGYEVWRTDMDFSSPKKVVSDLGGCCGQCDIQATEQNLILAENTKFQVGLLDRDGNRVSSFGQQDRTSKDGFGSCCNPMNVRCCSNGDILTAESSIGYIKRFNSEGELVGTVGKARIGGGCKHVAIGFDEKRDIYYMQYQDRNQICVMVPLADAPEFTEEEIAANEARKGLCQKLVGNGKEISGAWSLTGKMPVASASQESSGLFGLISQVLGTNTETEVATVTEGGEGDLSIDISGSEQVSYFKFLEDGKLEMKGGYFEQSGNTWEPISQDTATNTVVFSHLQEGIQYYDYKVKFIDDNTAEFSMLYGDEAMSASTYHRIPTVDEAKPEKDASVSEVSSSAGSVTIKVKATTAPSKGEE